LEDAEDQTSAGGESEQEKEKEPQAEVVDPVCPLSSPVTKGGKTASQLSPIV
jgi:hypothetical protein